MIDHGQPAIEALQRECNRVETCQPRQQFALPGKCNGRTGREFRPVEKGEPVCRDKRYRAFRDRILFGDFRPVDEIHVQAGSAGRLGDPDHAAPDGKRARVDNSLLAGLHQSVRPRMICHVTR